MSLLSLLGLSKPASITPSNDPVVAQVRLSDYRQMVELLRDLQDTQEEITDLREENKQLKQKVRTLETGLSYLA